jgi:hypothetical protein
MVRPSDSDHVTARISEADLRAQLDLPPLPLDDVLDSPAVRERIGILISQAMRRGVKPGH